MNPVPETSELADPAQRQSALFGSLVLQNANMAWMFLGRMPHPDTGKTELNLEAASMFIDTLEMLEAKTRGNLDPEESALLKETLTTLRFSFVATAENQPDGAAPNAPTAPSPPAATAESAPAEPAAQAADAEARKKFVKRY
jgi:hypothetical protein